MVRPSPDVSVREEPDGRFHVEVRTGATTTTHEVTVPGGYPAEIGCGHVDGADLVAASFAFLLEREPPTSILARFRLPQIADYFPEYPGAIGRYLA
jgi:hypothetical protein